jgi:hypothetical protein
MTLWRLLSLSGRFMRGTEKGVLDLHRISYNHYTMLNLGVQPRHLERGCANAFIRHVEVTAHDVLYPRNHLS